MSGRWCDRWSGLLLAWAILFGTPAVGWAQEASADESTEEADEEELTKGSTETTLQTIDGVYLTVRLWLPEKPKIPKETPIVLLLHMRGKSQRDWFPFAKFLQENGFAVCSFDFRGHGESREVNPEIYVTTDKAMKVAAARNPIVIQEPVVPQGARKVLEQAEKVVKTQDVKGRQKPKETIDASEEFKSGKEMAFALPADLQTVKEFLINKHNEGSINIRRLGIVGAEMGALVALEWIQRFEFRANRTRGWEKIDGDLAALVLLSPQTAYWGQKSPFDFSVEASEVPIMIVATKDGKGGDEAERVARKLKVPERALAREDASAGGKDNKPKVKPRGKERPDSGLFRLESQLVGSDLLRPAVEEIDKSIGGFLKDVLTREKSRNWERRSVDPDRSGFGTDPSK
jgi:alpha-beta hydrolase superfamily lysophospholipase